MHSPVEKLFFAHLCLFSASFVFIIISSASRRTGLRIKDDNLQSENWLYQHMPVTEQIHDKLFSFDAIQTDNSRHLQCRCVLPIPLLRDSMSYVALWSRNVVIHVDKGVEFKHVHRVDGVRGEVSFSVYNLPFTHKIHFVQVLARSKLVLLQCWFNTLQEAA